MAAEPAPADWLPADQPFLLFYNYDPTDPPRFHRGAVGRDYFDWLFSLLAGTGLTFLFRCNTAGRAYYPSQVMAPFDHGCVDPHNPAAQYWHRVADMLDLGDPLAAAMEAARRHRVPIWAWVNWNEFQCVRRDYVSLIDPVWYAAPRKYWCSRDGSRFYHGIPDFGDAEVQQRLAAMTAELLGYGVDGLYLSTRSHSWYACFDTPGWADHLQPFGFNERVVADYRSRHGVDIRYQAYDEDEFHRIKGDHFSEVITSTGAALHRARRPFVVGISPDRYELCVEFADKGRPGARHLLLHKDWERWVADGAVDAICAERSCPHRKILEAPPLELFRRTLPEGFPLLLWLDTARYHNRGYGPFHLGNWDRYAAVEVVAMAAAARQAGARGALLHSLYHYTSLDSGGESIGGYGVLPRREYFAALRRWSASGMAAP